MRSVTRHGRAALVRTLSRRAALFAMVSALLSACARTGHDPQHVQVRPAAAITAAAAPRAEPVEDRDESFSVFDLDSRWLDQAGRSLSLREVGGKAIVVSMIYTSCTATCPRIIADLKRIESTLLPGELSNVRFVLVSLDSERDTPGQLATWAQELRLDASRWTLLSGSDGAVRELAATLHVRYQQQASGEIAHTNEITILDGRGQPRLRHGLGQVEPAAHAVRALLQ
jgi:protein SCO1